ncbi:centrosomal protein of 170 kDa isoform X3 [Rhinatrema bivittatum]|uniref:centrosomal protein of 170 kDa isoform X3 n=1 Tax=Rhinatrema bivittatum TaxID=194408 RepID=UPI001128F90F|nr:centrosomal protein of 170 kDa isoform X3 [Rhinatrema bivittatum]
MSLTSWFLVSSGGTRHRLPREMIFVGRDDCELMLQSRSVDKQHAVVNYKASTDEHLVKDLGSLNGTFVNDVRIPEQTYITLKLDDKLRFGYDTNLFTVVRGELRVPEEALKHEKFTSQLQLSQKSSDSEGSKPVSSKAADTKEPDVPAEAHLKAIDALKSEDKTMVDFSAMPRGTPLYGQPSWWGEDAEDENSSKQDAKEGKISESGASGCSKEVRKAEELSAAAKEETFFPFCREPSYFEIPTKEFQQPSQLIENTIHEIPTKDTHNSQVLGAGHASFTIEFDDSSPGKLTIKDHVTKFTPDHRQKVKKPSPSGAKELAGLQTEMMAAESKVADWLAQNNPPLMVREPHEDDSKSIKSDVPVYLKRLRGNKHDDGTQSDSENTGVHKGFGKSGNLEDHLRRRHTDQKKFHQKIQVTENSQEPPVLSQTAYTIEFDEDHARKKRSYSFTQNAGILCPESNYPVPHTRFEKLRCASGDSKGVSLVLQAGSVSHKATHVIQHTKLLKQKSDDPTASVLFSQTVLLRSSGSLGHRPSENLDMDKEPEIPASPTAIKKDSDDDQSDKGTYTIELETPNPEEVEARKMIDKVFGVDDSPYYNKHVVNEDKKYLCKTWTLSSTTAELEGERPQQGTTGLLDLEEGAAAPGSKRWVSQWASLAANHTMYDQGETRLESSALAPLENDADISESGISVKSSGSAASLASQNERKRRTLPQLPKEERKSESYRVKATSHQRSDVGEKQDTEPQEKETPIQISKKKQRELDTRITANVSKSINDHPAQVYGESAQFSLTTSYHATGKEKRETSRDISLVKQFSSKMQQEQKEKAWMPTKSSSKHVTNQTGKNGDDSPRTGPFLSQKTQGAIPGHAAKKAELKEDKKRKSEEVLKIQIPKGVEAEKKEASRPLVRQGSFTIDKPSTNVPIELIPHISKQNESTLPSFAITSTSKMGERSDSIDTDSSMDTTLLLKDTEAVMAFLEAKLREENKTDEGPETPSYNRDNSISPESDVDTASTISLVTGDADKKCLQKRKSFSSLYKERCSTSSPSKDSSKLPPSGSRDKLEKKSKSRSSDVGTKADSRKLVQTSGRIRQPSLDLTDDDQTSSVPHSAISDILSSDQETYSGKSQGRVPFTSVDDLLHSKVEGNKSAKYKSSPVLPGPANKSTTLPRPRPTRTSLLRRARLGEGSDTELADADKVSVASEVSTTSSTSKPPSGRKTALSRIDLLAQPRRTRLGSLSARSDSEATITRNTGSPRTPDSGLRSGLRTAPQTDMKGSPRIRANSISRLPDSKARVMSSTHSTAPEKSQPLPDLDPGAETFSVNSRWRRFPPDYASTSEDEFGSNRNSPKHARLRTSPALKNPRQQNTGTSPGITATASPPAATTGFTLKQRIKEQEDYIRDWTAHRAEIARISQDLALIAREINDVTGEIDSVTSSGTAPSTTVSTAATTPGSAIDTREELVDRVFDESLNFRKIPPLVHGKAPEGNSKASDSRIKPKDTPEPLTITRRKTWSRDEVMGDTLLLSSVFQFSRKIRQSIDKTAGKIRILFKDKDRNWEEIESKLRAESEIPILKSASMEILSILQELKRVEKQLQVINAMIDPDGTLDALNSLGFSSSMLPAQSKLKSTPTSQTICTEVTMHGQPEARAVRSAIISVSSEFDSVESEPDFSIHFNRFNPDGEEEDTTIQE